MEEENRKKRAAQAFSKFFVAKKKNEAAIVEDETSKDSAASAESMGLVKSSFMPFQIRERMTVAPIVRLDLSRDRLQALDDSLKTSKPLSELYLRQLRSGSHKPKFSEKTLPNDEKEVDDDDVVIVGELTMFRLRQWFSSLSVLQMISRVLERTSKPTSKPMT